MGTEAAEAAESGSSAVARSEWDVKTAESGLSVVDRSELDVETGAAASELSLVDHSE